VFVPKRTYEYVAELLTVCVLFGIGLTKMHIIDFRKEEDGKRKCMVFLLVKRALDRPRVTCKFSLQLFETAGRF